MTNNNSYGGGQNTYKINPLFKDVKEYNKYLLSSIGIFVLLLSGIISYNYTNTSYAKWSSSVESKNILKLHVKTEKSASEFAKTNVKTGGLEEITHEIDDTLQVDERFKTEYRYRGGNVNNYVTFNNEVWRIIGIIPTEDTDGNVEDRFKIIRDTSIGNKYWDDNYKACWTTSTLNEYLNVGKHYYNTINEESKNMIGTTKYYLGGYSDTYNINSDTMWQYERKKKNGNDCKYDYDNNSQSGTECYFVNINPIMQNDSDKKIAIMYTSDYGYAASKKCTSNLYGYSSSTDCKTTNNWLDKSEATWLLSQDTTFYGSSGAFAISSTGSVNYDVSTGLGQCNVYPVLTLSSNVKISSGTGTSSEPYQLSIS